MHRKFVGLILLTCALSTEALANHGDRCQPAGTFSVVISGIGPSFQQLITHHHGGTLSETNSRNPGVALGSWNLKWKDWFRNRDCRVSFRFTKLLFDETGQQHIGFLVVAGDAFVKNDVYESNAGMVEVRIVLDTTNPDTPPAQIFTTASAFGKRLTH